MRAISHGGCRSHWKQKVLGKWFCLEGCFGLEAPPEDLEDMLLNVFWAETRERGQVQEASPAIENVKPEFQTGGRIQVEAESKICRILWHCWRTIMWMFLGAWNEISKKRHQQQARNRNQNKAIQDGIVDDDQAKKKKQTYNDTLKEQAVIIYNIINQVDDSKSNESNEDMSKYQVKNEYSWKF